MDCAWTSSTQDTVEEKTIVFGRPITSAGKEMRVIRKGVLCPYD